MTLDYQTVKSWPFDDVVQRYEEKDTMLYALGIGLGYDPMDERQLPYVYEEKTLRAFPTMSVVLGFPGFWVRDPRTGIDWVRVVHGEQRLTMHAPLPASGTVVGKTRVSHVVDKGAGKGAIVVSERTLHDEGGKLLATLQQSTFCRGDGGFGQGDAPPEALPATPDAEPDRSCTLQVAPNAALLYRLNADPNPLHADPQVARKAGFERPILHGAEYEGWIWWLLLNGLMDVLLVVAIAIAAAVAIRRIWRAIMDRRARGQKPMDREG